MINPEVQVSLSPEVIYQYDTHRNIPWNQTDYKPVRQYLDPRKQVTERKFAEIIKGGKDANYVTKKGFYMDYHLKTVKVLPSPVQYQNKDLWSQEENIKKSKNIKIDANFTKNTYIDMI